MHVVRSENLLRGHLHDKQVVCIRLDVIERVYRDREKNEESNQPMAHHTHKQTKT